MANWGLHDAPKVVGLVLIFILCHFEPGESSKENNLNGQQRSPKGYYSYSSADYSNEQFNQKWTPYIYAPIRAGSNSFYNNYFSGFNPYGGYAKSCKPGVLPRDSSNTFITYQKQSPINIQPKINNVKYCSKLRFINHDIPQTFNITNTGVYIEFIWAGNPGIRPRITSGPLKGTYELKNLHLHTNPNDPLDSSEHALFGQKFDAEVHAVYAYEGYSESEIAYKRDAIFVIALFIRMCPPAFEARLGPSRDLNRALNVPDFLEQSGSSYVWDSQLPLTWSKTVPSMPAYLYDGSSTTPPYRENFVFYVIEEPFCLSPNVLQLYRSLRDRKGRPLGSNVRSLQDRNGRPIQRLQKK